MRTFGAFIDWLLRNFLRMVIIAAIIFAVLSFGLQTCEGDPTQLPGSVDDTTYKVQTYSRIYYTNSYEWQSDTLVLHGFWVQEGTKWRQYKRDLLMPRETYGKVEVTKR